MPTIGEFYQLHLTGRLEQEDARWADVDRLLMEFAKGTVKMHCRGLIGLEREQLEEAVQLRLFSKFMHKRIQCAEGQPFERLLNRAAKNDMIDELRGSRSISAQSASEKERRSMSRQHQAESSSDQFTTIREQMQPFRFREYFFVRDAVLAFFLQCRSFPPLIWLKTLGVPSDHRSAVYNSALYDINTSIRGMAA